MRVVYFLFFLNSGSVHQKMYKYPSASMLAIDLYNTNMKREVQKILWYKKRHSGTCGIFSFHSSSDDMHICFFGLHILPVYPYQGRHREKLWRQSKKIKFVDTRTRQSRCFFFWILRLVCIFKCTLTFMNGKSKWKWNWNFVKNI